jgi:diaminopimelate decarboxylase
MGELQLAKEVGYLPGKIEFTGPGKTEDELSLAIDMDISCINVESISEIRKIAGLALRKGKKARIGIRVNPRRRVAEPGMKMGGENQFGMIEDDLNEAFKLIKLQNGILHFVGFHMHLGSQFLTAERLLSNFRFVVEKSYEFAQQHGMSVEKINFGGGWGIDVFGKTPPLDLTVIQNGLSQLFNEAPFKDFCRGIRLVVEPGRFMVAECGVYTARILYRKFGYQKEFLILDGGMHHLYGAAGGIGQIIRRNYEIDWVLRHEDGKGKKRFSIVGSLCLPDDVMASDAELPCCIDEGDTILFFNSGAYGLTASPQKFLSHPPAREYLTG